MDCSQGASLCLWPDSGESLGIRGQVHFLESLLSGAAALDGAAARPVWPLEHLCVTSSVSRPALWTSLVPFTFLQLLAWLSREALMGTSRRSEQREVAR